MMWANDIGGSTVLSFLVAAGLLAQPNIEAVLACMKIDDDDARLACYDVQLGRAPGAVRTDGPRAPGGPTAAAAVVEAGTAPAATAAAAVAAPAAQASAAPVRPEDDFGLTAERREARAAETGRTEKTDHITAIVRTAKMTASGRLLVTLDNGQQWVQVEPSRTQYFFEGDPITIKKAAFGSFLASGPKSGTGIRIRRLD
jgi:hypothetical protein